MDNRDSRTEDRKSKTEDRGSRITMSRAPSGGMIVPWNAVVAARATAALRFVHPETKLREKVEGRESIVEDRDSS